MKLYYKINGKQYTIPNELEKRIVDLSVLYDTPSAIYTVLLLKAINLLHHVEDFKFESLVPYPIIAGVIEEAIDNSEIALYVFHISNLLNYNKLRSFKLKGYTLKEWEDDIKTSRFIFLDFREYFLKKYFSSYVNFTYNMFDDLNKYKGIYTISINSSSLTECNIPDFINIFDHLITEENMNEIVEYFGSVGGFDEKKYLHLEEANVLNSLSVLTRSKEKFFQHEETFVAKCKEALECICSEDYLSKFVIDCIRAFINGYGVIPNCSKKKQSDIRNSLSAICKSKTLIDLTEVYIPYINLANKINNINI